MDSEQTARLCGHDFKRGTLALDHVRVKLRWPPNGLTGIVNNEIEPLMLVKQTPAQRLDAGRAAHVQSKDFQAMSPFAEVRFLRVALGRIAREPRGDNQMRARPKKLQ